mgnify:CR=1 FL=1|jgi:hypothetical protein
MAGALPTQGNQIIVDPPSEGEVKKYGMQPGSELVSWVIGKVNPWEDHRNTGWAARWKQYWRVWRGVWDQDDKTRKSERSRLIAPALAQAIDAQVAEVESATIDQDVWFDVADDIADEQSEKDLDVLLMRDQLKDDLDRVNARDALSEAILNAAIFGTGILKINTDLLPYSEAPVRNPETLRLEKGEEERVVVTYESIRPDEFIPDPSATTVQEGLGCAHRPTKPLHSVLEKIELGIYRRDALAMLAPGRNRKRGAEADYSSEPQVNQETANAESVEITEYHGKVPAKLLAKLSDNETPLDSVLAFDMAENPDEYEEGPMIEAIITIANQSVLLRAMANPFVMSDRSVIAFQWEKVPGRFWGRGVAEKGINPQKALDAELRSRIDALGFISAPMLGVDSGRLPRGFRMEVKPGKVWMTNGPPREILQPIEIGALQQNTFNQTQEMERMVQMGTGAFDTAGALSAQSSQSGASASTSNSMMMGAFAKRSKRTVGNVCRNLIQPAIKKAIWRYMQFDSQRYQKDYNFVVKASMGIVAREVEAMQLTQLLGMLPETVGPQISAAVAKGIIEMSSVSNKAEVVQALRTAMQPPSEEDQQRQKALQDMEFAKMKAEAEQVIYENQKLLAETKEIISKAFLNTRRGETEDRKVDVEEARVDLQGAEILNFQKQNDIAMKRLELQEKQVDAKLREMQSK